MRLASLTFALLLIPACHPGPGAPHPEQLTQSAAECHFTMPDSSLIYAEKDTDDPAQLVETGPQRWPEDFRQYGIDGWVEVHFVIGPNGSPIAPSIEVDRASNGAFIEPAMDMLKGSYFRPATLGGLPVAVCVTQTIKWVVR